jgi:hypothetical protein
MPLRSEYRVLVMRKSTNTTSKRASELGVISSRTFFPWRSISAISSEKALIVHRDSMAGYSHIRTQPSAPAVIILVPLWLNRTRFYEPMSIQTTTCVKPCARAKQKRVFNSGRTCCLSSSLSVKSVVTSYFCSSLSTPRMFNEVVMSALVP